MELDLHLIASCHNKYNEKFHLIFNKYELELGVLVHLTFMNCYCDIRYVTR